MGAHVHYGQLIPISEWVTALFPVARESQTGEAIAFFVYDVPKVLSLLTGNVFVTGVLRRWFSREKDPRDLGGQAPGLGLSAGHPSGRADAEAGILGNGFPFNFLS